MLGLCFNNAVDFEATKFCLGKFSGARILMIPTEPCKMGPYTHHPKVYESLSAIPEREATRAALVELMSQWTEMKQGVPQAMFDTITVMKLRHLIASGAIVRADVIVGIKNEYALGTPYEEFGMALHSVADPPVPPANKQPLPASVEDVKGRLDLSSSFDAGIYAFERVFTNEALQLFMEMFLDAFATP